MAVTNSGITITIKLETLEDVANAFLQKEYGLTLDIPIIRNNRYRRTMGAFVREYDETTNGYIPSKIEIAGWVLERCHVDAVIDTLKHECVHYALYTLGIPHSDGQAEFEAELKRLGITSNYD